MSDTLKIEAAANGWVCIQSDAKGRHYAHEVIIAGNDLDFGNTGSVTVEAETWAIQSKLYPSLLIETPRYYSGDGKNERSDNDVVFYTDSDTESDLANDD